MLESSMMFSERIAIFTTTRKNDNSFPLSDTVSRLGLDSFLRVKYKNDQAISVVYNQFLEESRKENLEYIIFIHDDVHLEHDPRSKLENLFKDFDIVGVAGCSKAEIKSPALWHLMGQGHLHGAVAHKHGDKKYMTSFGAYPQRVVMIDGVFMAFNRKAIETVRFDEECPSKWHFYDLNCVLDAHNKGLKIGVGDIMITHESHGLKEFSEYWKMGEKYFLDKYGK
jgi:hypothetical protein